MGLDSLAPPGAQPWALFAARVVAGGRTLSPAGERRGWPLTGGALALTGRERLAACLGVTLREAARFGESFLQKYKKIKDFTQATIARCHQTGKPAAAKATPLPRLLCRSQGLSRPLLLCRGGEQMGGVDAEAGVMEAGCVGTLMENWDQKAPCRKSPEPGSSRGNKTELELEMADRPAE